MEKTRAVYQLDTPFSSAQWPKISQEDQDSILDLLCNLLSPIGQHRKTYVQPSKGKRIKAKKRKIDQDHTQQDQKIVVPPLPAVAGDVDVGLSHITRSLQLDLNSSAPETNLRDTKSPRQLDPYSVIFVARSGPPSAFFGHLPQMVAIASKSRQSPEPIRLVGFSKSCEERLSACMGVPRVTSIALRQGDTAQSKALVDFVRARVPLVEAPWLEEAEEGRFRETKIRTIQAPIGKKRSTRS